MRLTWAIEDEFEEWPYRHLEEDIFGTVDPDRIVDVMDEFCRVNLGSGIQQYLFYAASIGSVHGVKLLDGREVVVKVNRGQVDEQHYAPPSRSSVISGYVDFPVRAHY